MNNHQNPRNHKNRSNRPRTSGPTGGKRQGRSGGDVYLYGLHAVRHAVENPERIIRRLHVNKNGLERLALSDAQLKGIEIREREPRELDALVGRDAVHQGAVLEVQPLLPKDLGDLKECNLVLLLDQITDPHNVGAILRSAVAMGAGAVISTHRHSAKESGVLAKSASGALDMIDMIEVKNLAHAMEELHFLDFQTIGLDSEGAEDLENTMSGKKIALVMGAEGKGLRQKTRESCRNLARIDMPGKIKSLNVSNATALSLYIAQNHLKNAS
ncbi:MAG: 23S rRNA (guanosine(2251)-2'-O)-methyltransferase RlmB [Hyphomicrobiales bacterium]|nr:MAG: 23S rRNA (guanosine(2251)-2'-O)-methyltransferase RlmB [Hyphomicrobiales bacterium]